MFHSLLAQRQRSSVFSAVCIFAWATKKEGAPLYGAPLFSSRRIRLTNSSLVTSAGHRRHVALERLGYLLFRHRANDLLHHLPILENEQRVNAADVVAARGVHWLIDVELRHLEPARIVVRDFR